MKTITPLKTNKMKQTAVEWLAEQINHPEIFNPYIEQAKEMEKQQIIDAIQLEKLNDALEKAKEMEKEQRGFSEKDMESAWNSSEQNMRFQFSSSSYKNVKFEKWLEIYKKEKGL